MVVGPFAYVVVAFRLQQSARQAADKAKSRILDLYDSNGSEAEGQVDDFGNHRDGGACGPAGPTPPPSVPRRAAAGNNPNAMGPGRA